MEVLLTGFLSLPLLRQLQRLLVDPEQRLNRVSGRRGAELARLPGAHHDGAARAAGPAASRRALPDARRPGAREARGLLLSRAPADGVVRLGFLRRTVPHDPAEEERGDTVSSGVSLQ